MTGATREGVGTLSTGPQENPKGADWSNAAAEKFSRLPMTIGNSTFLRTHRTYRSPSSQVLRNQLKFPKRHPPSCARRLQRAVKTMTDMIVNQGFFCILNRALDGLELLRKLMARAVLFDHFDDHTEMPVCAL
jgi:hypothetical protein